MSTVCDEIAALPCGARFLRADLHIHSFGASHDVKDTSMTPAAIVDTAVSEGLGLIALTDHNEICNVLTALKAADGKPVLVVPGVELSTPEGHLLVYFADYESLSNFHGKLDFADRGTQTSRCQTALLECLKRIDLARGFAVLAHVDAEAGLEDRLPGYPPHKGDIISHPALLGIELQSADSIILYSRFDEDPERRKLALQRTTALGLGVQQSLARVLFSDSHSLSALGKNAKGLRRLTRIKMDGPSFAGLRVALQDGDARIRLEDDVPQSVARIMGIKLECGFLDGLTVHFSRNLNCIIGGRGAGKSTAFEAVRCIAPVASASKLVDCEIWPDTLHLVWVDEVGHQTHLRRPINESLQNLTDPDIGAVVFPIESYGQNETAQTSVKAQSDPAALLEYLDQFVRLEDLKAEEEKIRSDVLENQTNLEKATQQVARIPEFKKLLATVQQQLKTLESANAREIVGLERKVAEERTLRESIEAQVGTLAGHIKKSSITTVLAAVESTGKPEDMKVGAGELKQILELTAGLQASAKAAESQLTAETQTFQTKVKALLTQWKAREQAVLTDIDTKRKELLAKGVRLDLQYIKKLAADEASHKESLKNLATWETHLKELQKARSELLARRQKIRTQIYTRRHAYAIKANAALRKALADLNVTVKFLESASSPEAEEIIQQATGWRTSQVPRAALIVEQLTVPKLLDAIRKNDPGPIIQVTGKDGNAVFNKSDALELLRMLNVSPVPFRLQRCLLDDLPRITITRTLNTGGKVQVISRDFAKLSLGQQQSILLALMLSSNSQSPLIIDQPEDNLDSEFIFHSLVPVLRAAKERRQIIVVTHNPNIAVLGDAEQIIALKSTNEKGAMVARGSIDDPNTRKMVCRILEGAEEAFKKRARMYGIT
ncbi:MAG: AAA family ATPase [Bryobacterales bacterium]|nr:AAA family ATPase [Bryobacterales bacterium]